jgi:hypothetical protein
MTATTATMADAAPQTPARSMPIPMRPPGMTLETPVQPRFDSVKTASATVGVMSPVNQDGCFEFDRIIKQGNAVKRTRKTRVSQPHAGHDMARLTRAVMEAHLPRPAAQLPLHLQGQGRD